MIMRKNGLYIIPAISRLISRSIAGSVSRSIIQCIKCCTNKQSLTNDRHEILAGQI